MGATELNSPGISIYDSLEQVQQRGVPQASAPTAFLLRGQWLRDPATLEVLQHLRDTRARLLQRAENQTLECDPKTREQVSILLMRAHTIRTVLECFESGNKPNQ